MVTMLNFIRRLRKMLLVLVALLLPSQELQAANDRWLLEKSDLRGTFSNICIHSETGDLQGTELSIIPIPTGFVILFQRAEGVLVKPVLLSPTQSTSHRMEVRDPIQGGIAFVAELKSKNELLLRFEDEQIHPDGTTSAILKRRLPSWSDGGGVGDCE
jgi:hypothetical protein